MGQSKLTATAKIAGGNEVIEALRGVKFGVGNRVLVAAMRKQAGASAKTAKALAGNAGQRTGLLKKSIGYLYRKPKRGTAGGGVFVIGPRSSVSGRVQAEDSRAKRFVKRLVGVKKRGPKFTKKVIKQFKGLMVKPYLYAHLVESGTKNKGPKRKKVMSGRGVLYGKKAKGVPARPFMKPTLMTLKSVGPGAIAADVKAGITREAAKYAAKGKSIYGTPGT